MSGGALTAPRAERRQPLLRLIPDGRLAKLAADGSSEAFATIYERHHQEIYRYCRSILADEHDARDALQNTMLKALRALEGETREIALRPWLFRIAHNESISLLRRRTPDASIESASELVAVEADPETRQRLRSLIGDLEQLAPRQRSALVMRELSGLSFAEIAAALQTSSAAAKQAVYEARLALHELEEGREVSCDEIRRKVSAEDRRLLRGRRVRAHLKACAECRRFAEQTRERRAQLAALAPPLPLPIGLGILHGIIGGGGGAGGGIGALLGGGGAAGIGAATAAKLGVAGVLVLGVGAVALERSGDSDATPKGQTTQAAQNTPDAAAANHAAAGTASHGSAASSGSAGRGANRGAAGDEHGHGRGGKGARGHGTPAAGGHSGGSSAGGAPTPGNEVSAGAAGNPDGTGPTSTPPGQGSTPPGQGGTPPGRGEPAPGQGGTVPGGGGSASPAHGGTPPGQGGTAPSQQQTPPGHEEVPAVDDVVQTPVEGD